MGLITAKLEPALQPRTNGVRERHVVPLPAGAVVAVLSLLTTVAGMLLYAMNLPLLKYLCDEDGVVESLTALCYFAAAICVIFVGRTTRFRRPAVLLYLAMFVFVAGEEISWGQRIFGLHTPELLNQINEQHELTLHNIAGLHSSNRMLGVLVQLALSVALPIICCLRESAQSWCRRIHWPVAPLGVAWAVGVGIVLMAYPRFVMGTIIPTFDEIGEMILGMAMLSFAVDWLRTCRIHHHPPVSEAR